VEVVTIAAETPPGLNLTSTLSIPTIEESSSLTLATQWLQVIPAT